MDLNKAIRKQKKSYSRFLLSMCFIFLSLPLILFISKKTTLFFLIYLGILELLIIIALIIRANYEGLKFSYDGYKLKIKLGFFREKINIICNKVVLVHVERRFEVTEIVIITTSNFKNKKIKTVSLNFLGEYPSISYYYFKIKKQFPESNYYYMIITKGGYIKYELLNRIFTSCVSGFFTEEAINTIKKYRS